MKKKITEESPLWELELKGQGSCALYSYICKKYNKNLATVGDVLTLRKEELIKIHGMGLGTLEKLEAKLKECGFKLEGSAIKMLGAKQPVLKSLEDLENIDTLHFLEGSNTLTLINKAFDVFCEKEATRVLREKTSSLKTLEDAKALNFDKEEAMLAEMRVKGLEIIKTKMEIAAEANSRTIGKLEDIKNKIFAPEVTPDNK